MGIARISFLAFAMIICALGIVLFILKDKIRIYNGNRSRYGRSHPRSATPEQIRFAAIVLMIMGAVGMVGGIFGSVRGY